MLTSPRPPDTVRAPRGDVEWLRRKARRLARDATAAEDLAQDAWLVFVARRPDASRSLRPWLGRVLGHVAAKARRRPPTEQVPAGLPGAGVDPAERLEALELRERLARRLRRLQEPLRTTVVLRYYEGLNATEIGRRLAVPPGTVRWRLKQGLERLRHDFESAELRLRA